MLYLIVLIGPSQPERFYDSMSNILWILKPYQNWYSLDLFDWDVLLHYVLAFQVSVFHSWWLVIKWKSSEKGWNWIILSPALSMAIASLVLLISASLVNFREEKVSWRASSDSTSKARPAQWHWNQCCSTECQTVTKERIAKSAVSTIWLRSWSKSEFSVC